MSFFQSLDYAKAPKTSIFWYKLSLGQITYPRAYFPLRSSMSFGVTLCLWVCLCANVLSVLFLRLDEA